MTIFNLSYEPERHRYVFGTYDRVTIDNVTYMVGDHARNEEGWLLQMDDGSGLSRAFSHAELSRLGSMKLIRVERNFFAPPGLRSDPGIAKTRLIAELPEAQSARLSKLDSYVQATLHLIAEGKMKMTDDSLKANMTAVMGIAVGYAGKLNGGPGTPPSQDIGKPPSPRTIRRAIARYKGLGMCGLIDLMDRRGNRTRQMTPEAYALMQREVMGYLSPERPNMKTIHDNVVLGFSGENEDRRTKGLHPLRIPSYGTVRKAILALDPLTVVAKREGIEAARKKFAPAAHGLEVVRPMQRVEMDETPIDIVSGMESAGLRQLLTEEELRLLGLNKDKTRWFVTVAIDAATRCIMAMTLSRTAGQGSSLNTLQMILRDKGKWSDATGSLGSWDMHGRPAEIVTDNGPAFTSRAFREACVDLGIVPARAPAGLASARGRNERWFHSLNLGLLPRIPGRTFGSIRERGKADPEERAVLTFEDLAFCLVRWVVDIYHNTPHAGLGGETPLSAWRRLTQEWGVQPPPDRVTQRIVFGQRLERKLTREGVTVLGMRYHSEDLARWMTGGTERDVEVRWHPDDMGAVTVYSRDRKLEVNAVHPGFDGISAREWMAANRELRAADPIRKAHDRQTVLMAIGAIQGRVNEAASLAGLLVDPWTPERIRKEEDRLFMNFRVTGDRPAPNLAADGIGRSILGPDSDREVTAAVSDHPAPAAPRRPADAGNPSAPTWKITE